MCTMRGRSGWRMRRRRWMRRWRRRMGGNADISVEDALGALLGLNLAEGGGF